MDQIHKTIVSCGGQKFCEDTTIAIQSSDEPHLSLWESLEEEIHITGADINAMSSTFELLLIGFRMTNDQGGEEKILDFRKDTSDAHFFLKTLFNTYMQAFHYTCTVFYKRPTSIMGVTTIKCMKRTDKIEIQLLNATRVTTPHQSYENVLTLIIQPQVTKKIIYIVEKNEWLCTNTVIFH